MPSGRYEHQKNTCGTILEDDTELRNLKFKKKETGFTDFTEIVYSSDENLEIKEEKIEYEATAGQKINKEYDSKLCNAGVKETDDFIFHNKLRSRNKKKIQEPGQERENNFKCQKRPRRYKSKKLLNQHQKLQGGVSPNFRCELCGKGFIRNGNLKAHVERVHHNTKSSQATHKCKLCTRSFFFLRNLIHHQRSHNPEVKRQFICDYCGYIAKWKSHLASHITYTHLQTSNRMHNCNQCSRSYTTLNNLKRHERLEHASIVPYFICDHCGFETKRKANLATHIIARHIQTPKTKLHCNKCSRSYNFLNSLLRHKRVQHAAVKPQFICDICGHKANVKYNLSAHVTARHLKL
ncbi:zinc finger protein 28-like [Belonocnema kinseyi]|uniref:zinc finger protein 28-like n=1 Tax=Belonocnema kinseyi TaxID=2817044 RepID=UPI00143DEEFB|nr:zinc finger protein 28-like [Belonocnema kinseyi]